MKSFYYKSYNNNDDRFLFILVDSSNYDYEFIGCVKRDDVEIWGGCCFIHKDDFCDFIQSLKEDDFIFEPNTFNEVKSTNEYYIYNISKAIQSFKEITTEVKMNFNLYLELGKFEENKEKKIKRNYKKKKIKKNYKIYS